MNAPSIAEQIVAIETCIRRQREALALARAIGLPTVDQAYAGMEQRVIRLQAAIATLRRLERGAPPAGAAA